MKSFSVIPAVGICLVLAASTASAQDFGAQWVDRITRELQAERAPLKEPSQFTYGAEGGVIFVYDTNIFLSEKDRISDQIFVPFVRANAAYAEPNWEISADLEVDYKYYIETQDARGDEERFMLKAGYAGPVLGGSIIQLIRNESDPIDAIFADRAERVVSDTVPRVYVDLATSFAIEFDGHVQIVRFVDNAFSDSRDNENYNAALALVYKTIGGTDFLVKGGFRAIHYNDGRNALGDPVAPPDVMTYYVMAGFRGEIRPDLYIEALAGWEHITTDDFEFVTVPERDGFEHNTMTASILVRYKAVDGLQGSIGYNRQVTFLGGNDPYQILDSVVAMAEYQATEQISVHARAQFSMGNSSMGVERMYSTVALLATYKPMEHLVFDGGVTGRFGNVTGDVANDTNYTDFVLQLGVGLAW